MYKDRYMHTYIHTYIHDKNAILFFWVAFEIWGSFIDLPNVFWPKCSASI